VGCKPGVSVVRQGAGDHGPEHSVGCRCHPAWPSVVLHDPRAGPGASTSSRFPIAIPTGCTPAPRRRTSRVHRRRPCRLPRGNPPPWITARVLPRSDDHRCPSIVQPTRAVESPHADPSKARTTRSRHWTALVPWSSSGWP
jgi:hypothetical protein